MVNNDNVIHTRARHNADKHSCLPLNSVSKNVILEFISKLKLLPGLVCFQFVFLHTKKN